MLKVLLPWLGSVERLAAETGDVIEMDLDTRLFLQWHQTNVQMGWAAPRAIIVFVLLQHAPDQIPGHMVYRGSYAGRCPPRSSRCSTQSPRTITSGNFLAVRPPTSTFESSDSGLQYGPQVEQLVPSWARLRNPRSSPVILGRPGAGSTPSLQRAGDAHGRSRNPLLPTGDLTIGMGRLWSLAGATGGNRRKWQCPENGSNRELLSFTWVMWGSSGDAERSEGKLGEASPAGS
jgi:hypothetical protein